MVFLAVICGGGLLFTGAAWADAQGPNVNAPFPLRLVPVKEPLVFSPAGAIFDDFLQGTTPGEKAVARNWAIALGKALLWDLQLGSDGRTACATCHFKAGVDNRITNTLNPGFNKKFNVGPPNSTLNGAQFPFHQRREPTDLQASKVLRDADDVVGSQGVRLTQFVDIVIGQAAELGAPLADKVFKDAAGRNTRQSTGRQAPTYINAAFNFSSFHDGRANNIFNGVNPFGPEDDNARVLADNAGALQPELVRIKFAALASQATGPPLSDVEMSFRGRTFPKIGKKMLGLRALAQQAVHANDSVFGVDPGGLPPNRFTPLFLNIRDASGTGLNKTYQELIELAFNPKYWQNTSQKITGFAATGAPTIVNNANPIVASGEAPTNEFTQMEVNFSLFLGLAIQLYESVLLADDTKFDQFQDGLTPFTDTEAVGLELFLSMGCAACHNGPEFAGHTQIAIQGFLPDDQKPIGAIGLELRQRFGFSFVDEGIYNIGVRPTREDVGRGGVTPALDTRPKPLVAKRTFPLAFSALALPKTLINLPPGLAAFVPDLPASPQVIKKNDMIQGAFKVPSLRNIELTGPYFHNGSVGTLAQILDFYTRGGNFPKKNAKNLHPAIVELFLLQGQDLRHQQMISFLLTLTDQRVKFEAAPFDHPAIDVPAGQDANGADLMLPTIPAVGAGGRIAELPPLPPLPRFLDLDPFAP